MLSEEEFLSIVESVLKKKGGREEEKRK